MNLLKNFISLIVATTTAFTGIYSDIPIKPAKEKAYTYAVRNIEQANSMSQGSGVTSGIVVIDRAKKNAMETNGEIAHKQMPLATLAKLPILLYAVRVDPGVASEENKDSISMVQGFSAEATTRMWDKYGGMSIIQDLSKRYQLQETTAKKTWSDTTMSAVDVARLINRFFNDRSVSAEKKKWTFNLLSKTPTNISGQDLNYGIPGVIDVNSGNTERKDDRNTATWMQGWSPSGEKTTARHSAGMVGRGYRFITVTMSLPPKGMSDEDANNTLTQVNRELIQGTGNDDSASKGDITLGGNDSDSPEMQRWLESQSKYQ